MCESGTCKAPGPKDGVKNGGESGIDCGGAHPEGCGNGQGCLAGEDCGARPATAGRRCATPSYDDKVKNGNETDVDCGGPDAPKKCATGLVCADHGDCESNG